MNTNCLTNIACPHCHHEDSFIIEVRTSANVTDDGAETFGDMFWDERSFIKCKHCEAGGTIAEFTRETPQQGARRMNAAALAVEAQNIESLTLPSDPDGKNNDRAAWAKIALDAFMKETRTDLEDALCDLLCDLMHLSDREPFDFEAALRHAQDLYLAETGQPGPLTW